MVRGPRKRSVRPHQKTLASGEVLVSQARMHLPTLTDEADIAPAEDTERDPESVRDVMFAHTPLPDDVDARLVDAQCTHALTRMRTVLGRGLDADVHIADRRASRRHASIFYTGSEFRIRDEGSANGTRLNGSKVGEYVLREGDEVRIGETVLRFHVDVKVSQ